MAFTLKSSRTRLATSATAILGIAALSGCGSRSAPEPEVYEPRAVTTPQPYDGSATTFAIGEEDGGYAAPADPFVTTFAVGEEDGTGPIPVEPNGGIGDGAGPIPFETGTAPSIGQVEGDYERIYIPPDAGATTFAIGEEG